MELEPPLPCRPPAWARSGHAQTLFGHVLPSRGARIGRGAPGVETLAIDVGGGDRLIAHFLGHGGDVPGSVPGDTPGDSLGDSLGDAPGDAPGDKLALLFHGLGGSSAADYVRRTARVCARRGYSVLAVNHRGCGEGAGLARFTYHSGRSDDLARSLAFADEHLPHRRRVCIGFSLSGNALLLQLAQRRAPLPDAALAFNPPVDLAGASRAISSGFNRVYDLRFVSHCRQGVRERRAAGLLDDAPRIPRFATLRDVDELLTAPLGGFRDADDYYARCSTHERLSQIDVPTVVVSSRDDPFVPPGALERARLSTAVHLHLEDHGGHVGYLSARPTPLGDRRWLDYAIDHYLAQLERRGRDGSGPS